MSIGFIDERPDEVGFIDDEYGSDYTPDSDAIPRATVAAALAELRAKLDVIRFFEQHKTQDDAMQAVTQCVDATIAKLDLQERQ